MQFAGARARSGFWERFKIEFEIHSEIPTSRPLLFELFLHLTRLTCLIL
jgi:hypothetical protein